MGITEDLKNASSEEEVNSILEKTRLKNLKNLAQNAGDSSVREEAKNMLKNITQCSEEQPSSRKEAEDILKEIQSEKEI